MKKSPAVIVAALIVALTAQTLPANASVTTTTLSGTIGGNAATQMAKGDVLSVKTQAPISLVGAAHQTVTTTWAPQGLALTDTADITYPENWSLEYTVDGDTWSGTAPGDLSTVVGVRADGDVNTLGDGMFETTASADAQEISSFSAATGGDGYNIGFGRKILINSYHHTIPTTVTCHYLNGSSCGANVTRPGYESGHFSMVHVDRTNNHMYQFVRQASTGDYGVMCLDYTNPSAPVNCPTFFTKLADSMHVGPSSTQWASAGGYANAMAPSVQDGTKLWSSESAHDTLICFDMSTEAPCGNGDNGFSITGTTGEIQAVSYLRVAARDGIVYYTTADNKMGCYDSSSHTLCGGNSPISIGGGSGLRARPVLIENTSGTFIGACDAYSRLCLTTTGTSLTIPSGLDSFWDAPSTAPNYYPTYEISNHKLYWGGPKIGGQNSHNISCFDFSTDAACAGFTMLATGPSQTDVTFLYTVNVDPRHPNCVWVNQDSGKIVPINGSTGAVGCDFGDAGATIPITASVTRMACDPADKVLTWDTLTIHLPDGVDPANVKVSINNSTDVAISGWQDLTIDNTGVIDISTLDIEDSGLDPIVHLVGQNGVTSSNLSSATATVTFTAAEPELCIDLTATPNCEGITPDPSSPDVPDGLVASSSSTVPDGGGDTVSSDDDMTITGTNTGSMCPAVLPGVPTNPLTVYFTSISPKLLPAAKRDIQRLMAANTFTSVTCVGYTQGNKTITWLAKQRAAVVCAYVKSLYPRMKTKPSITKQTGKQFTYRSVLLTGH